MLFYDFLKEGFDFYFQEFKKKNINNYDKKYHTNYISIKEFEKVIYAELSGDFPLGDSRQPIYKSLRPFDLVS